jgi:hypothetical protein
MATVVDGVKSKWVYAGDQYVAVASGRIDGGWDEVMANARLIAAAPALLAACRDYDDAWTETCPEGPEAAAGRLGASTVVIWKMVRAAIAQTLDPEA